MVNTENSRFYLSVVAILMATLFFGFLVFLVWRQQMSNTITVADIQKAREIIRRLEESGR